MVGPPNCGAKELSLELSGHFKAETLSMGDLLRKEVLKGTALGDEIEPLLREGIYVPDQTVVDVLWSHLSKLPSKTNVFVEGYPKTLFQYKLLLEKGVLPNSVIRLDDSLEKKIKAAR